MQPERQASARAQQAFADHVRDPSLPPPAGIAPERMAVYTRLVRNNLKSFLDLCFSDSSGFAEPQMWESLQQRFLPEARPESPFFNDIPAQFLAWLETLPAAERPSENILAMMRFEADLLHAETAVQNVSDGIWSEEGVLVWAQTARLRHYGCDFVTGGLERFDPEESDVLSWRNRRDEVYYRTVEGVDLFLLQHFQEQGSGSFAELAAALGPLMPGQDAAGLLRPHVAAWVEEGVLLPQS